MKASVKNALLRLRESRLFLGAGVIVAWICFFGVLEYSGLSHRVVFPKASAETNTPKAPVAADKASVDLLETDCATFNLAELNMGQLRSLIRQGTGLDLVSSPQKAGMVLKRGDHSGKFLAEILVDLLRPQGCGFFMQGKSLHVTDMTIKQEKQAGLAPVQLPFQSSLVRTTIQARVGQPIDLWVDNAPLMRLRISARPVPQEPGKVALDVEGFRNRNRWFFHNLETAVGAEASLDSKAGGHMWCMLSPLALTDTEITLKMEFYYETVLPSV